MNHQANLEPLKVFELLLTVLFVPKAADSWPGWLDGWMAGGQNLHVDQQPSEQKEL
jgi:hypothetical protein